MKETKLGRLFDVRFYRFSPVFGPRRIKFSRWETPWFAIGNFGLVETRDRTWAFDLWFGDLYITKHDYRPTSHA